MAATRLPAVCNNPSKIQLERIAHVYFEHPHLEAFESFAKAFGLVEIYRDDQHVLYGGYGKDPYCYVSRKSGNESAVFGGAAFIAQTGADFDKAAAMDGATVSDMTPFPGGGRKVTLKSPSGFPFHVVYGQKEKTAETGATSAQVETQGPLNGSLSKQRLGKFQRFHPGPAMIHKLGHYGFILARWDEECRWYTENFNFVPSDVQHEPGNEDLDVITFMHLDHGERFSDHHSLFLARATPGEQDRLHHSSFEVDDFDTQLLGHQWLDSKGYRSVWGVGRHILGSQIFDYWSDPSGFIIEHYADGDLVNIYTGTQRSQAGPLSVWGPELPADMFADGTKKKDTASV